MFYFIDDLEFLILLVIAGGVLGMLSFVLSIVLFKRTAQLKKQMQHMEQYLKEKTAHLTAPKQQMRKERPAVSEQMVRQEVAKIEDQVFPTAPSEPSALERFGVWLKTDWLMKLGGFFLILGLAWFVNYAFAEEWIGPMGRIAVGLLFGAGVLALGRYRMGRFISQGSILMFVGALIVVFTVWVGQTPNYGLFTQMSALMLMFLTSCVLGFMSVLFSYKPLAYGNVAIAAVAPMLVTTSTPSFAGLMTYLLVLSLGAIWVAGLKGWRGLILTSLTTVFLYSLPFLEEVMYKSHVYGGYANSANYEYYQNKIALATQYADTGLMFAFIFSALFFAVSVWGMRKITKVSLVDLLTAALTGVYLLLWILFGAGEEWQSLILVFWTIVFAFGAFTAVRLGAKLPYFFTYLGVGVMFLGTATALELDGETLTIAYILESAALILTGYFITRSVKALWVLALPSIVPLVMSLGSMSNHLWAQEGIFSSDAFVLYLIVAITFYLANVFHREHKRLADSTLAHIRNIAVVLGMVYATITVWYVSVGLFSVEQLSNYRTYTYYDYDGAAMVALFIYTMVASYFYIRSKAENSVWKRNVAIAYFIIIVGRLLFIDVWNMGLFFRVITFCIIGAIIVTVAWFEKSNSKHLTSTNKHSDHE